MRMKHGVPRLLINKEHVGEIGSRGDDVVLLKNIDEGVRMLAEELGWLKELEEDWARTELPKTWAQMEAEEREKNMTENERLNAEVEKLTKEVEKSLVVTKDWVETHLEKSGGVPSTTNNRSDIPTITISTGSEEVVEKSLPSTKGIASESEQQRKQRKELP